MEKKAKDSLDTRQFVENHTYQVEELRKLPDVVENITQAIKFLNHAQSVFLPIKSPDISPDAKLGGKGYVRKISDLKIGLLECLNKLSDMNDTLADELHNPLWNHLLDEEDRGEIEEVVDKKEELDDSLESSEESEMEEAVEESKSDEEVEQQTSEEEEALDKVEFEFPTKTSSFQGDSLSKKIAKVYLISTGKLPSLEELSSIKTFYKYKGNIQNLYKTASKEDRLTEYKKLLSIIETFKMG